MTMTGCRVCGEITPTSCLSCGEPTTTVTSPSSPLIAFGRSLPLLRRDDPIEEVLLRAGARERILHEAKTASDARESGGALFGPSVVGWGDTEVIEATGPGPRARFGRDYLQLDREHILDIEDELLATGTPLLRIGSWHTHRDRDADPSSTDVASWRAGFELLEQRADDRPLAWTALIVTERDSVGVSRYERLHAFVLRRDTTGRLVYGGAQIQQEVN